VTIARFIHAANSVVIASALPFGANAQRAKTAAKTAAAPSGAQVYSTTCAACHQAAGTGLPEKYPPLASSEMVGGDDNRLIRIVLQGLKGEIEVQGGTYNGEMPGWGPTLSNAQLAAVLTYVRSSWGNSAPAIAASRIAQVRAANTKRNAPWTIEELARARGVTK
jgi:mono/diheme cytochrome c family protein